MPSLRFALPLIGLVALATGCGGSKSTDASVPRPKAYPRIEIADTIYRTVESAPIHFEANAATTDSTERSDADATWVNVDYPAYDATVYCTFTAVTPATLPGVVANREERMALNTGGYQTEIITLTSPAGYESKILVTTHGSSTPVQFLSVGRDWVVNGTLYLESAASAPDSVAPIIDAVRRDIIHATENLR